MRVKQTHATIDNQFRIWFEYVILFGTIKIEITMKLWKSKKNNNNNASNSNVGSTSTISCVPGKSSSLNKSSSDAKADTATTSSTTVSGKHSSESEDMLQTEFSHEVFFLLKFYFINKTTLGFIMVMLFMCFIGSSCLCFLQHVLYSTLFFTAFPME